MDCVNFTHLEFILLYLWLSFLDWLHFSVLVAPLFCRSSFIKGGLLVAVHFLFKVFLELVSEELNHLSAILHVYARGLNFMK